MSCDPPWVLYSAAHIEVTMSFQNNLIIIRRATLMKLYQNVGHATPQFCV